MVLYTADILEKAEPIQTTKKTKKTKKVADPDPVAEKVAEGIVEEVKENKPPTEKQLAARERAKEKRLLKKKELEEEKAVKLKQLEDERNEVDKKMAALAEKKRLRQEARKAKKESVTPPPSEVSEDKEEEVKEKKKKRPADPNEPPPWFQKYIAGVKDEEAKQSSVKRTKKEISEESKTVAADRWNDGLVRDRVQNEVDNHMNRMYTMMFGNRRL